jgi:hypothetical protein
MDEVFGLTVLIRTHLRRSWRCLALQVVQDMMTIALPSIEDVCESLPVMDKESLTLIVKIENPVIIASVAVIYASVVWVLYVL